MPHCGDYDVHCDLSGNCGGWASISGGVVAEGGWHMGVAEVEVKVGGCKTGGEKKSYKK